MRILNHAHAYLGSVALTALLNHVGCSANGESIGDTPADAGVDKTYVDSAPLPEAEPPIDAAEEPREDAALTAAALYLDFNPSNIDVAGHTGTILGGMDLPGPDPKWKVHALVVDTDTLAVTFYDSYYGERFDVPSDKYLFEVQQQTAAGAQEVAVLMTGWLVMEAGESLTVRGSRPLVLVAAEWLQLADVTIENAVIAGPEGSVDWNGLNGIGPGGGRVGANGTSKGGSGGGGFCSPGGQARAGFRFRYHLIQSSRGRGRTSNRKA